VSQPLELTTTGEHPELNGRRLQGIGQLAEYLVIDGVRRLIPNPDTYTALFRDGNGIQKVIDIDAIDDGGPPRHFLGVAPGPMYRECGELPP
jgi:hypothetical protein